MINLLLVIFFTPPVVLKLLIKSLMPLPGEFDGPGWLQGIWEYNGKQYGAGLTRAWAESFTCEENTPARIKKLNLFNMLFI